MKKLLLVALVVALGFTANAQNSRFGATAGYLNGNAKLKSGGESITGSDSGFYLGLLGEFEVSEKFNIQPEVVYANIDDASFLQIPINAKFYASEEFSILAGPQITYTLEEVGDDFTKLNIGLGLGIAYDFTEEFFVETRYTFQLNNYYTGPGDLKSTVNWLNVGIGYKFN